MIEIPAGVEGELLIRAILRERKRLPPGDQSNVLRIVGSGALFPSLPQIAAKSGFQSIEIITDDSDGRRVAPGSFKWQGVDDTQINIEIQSAEPAHDGPGINRSSSQNPVQKWYGELPISPYSPWSTKGNDLQKLAGNLRDMEFLCTISSSGLADYPRAELSTAWEVLLNRSSSEPGPVNIERLQNSNSETERISAAAIAELAASIDTRGLKRPILVINNHSFYANEVVLIKLGQNERPVTAIGPEGDAEQVQILENPDGDGENYAIFVAKNVPLNGYAVWDLGATLSPTESDDTVTASRTHLENSSIRIEFDHATGLILKIFDKDGERDLLDETFEVQRNGRRNLILQSCANLFEVKKIDGVTAPITQLTSVEVAETGHVRGAIRFVRTLPDGRSTIRQTVRLTARSTRIDFVTVVDWHEDDGSLSVSFPVAINSSRAAYEIPFGYIERPTFSNHRDDTLTADNGHSWVDLSEGDYGVALFNDCQFACEASGSTLRIHLPNSKSMSHWGGNSLRFTYSLLPHGCDLREGEVIENGFAICSPPACIPIVGNRPGKLPLERSFFEVDSASVFVSSIKQAEMEDNAIIVRLNEAHNTRGVVLLTTTLPVKTAWLCDLMENKLAEIPLDHGEALLPFHPFEIITVKYEL